MRRRATPEHVDVGIALVGALLALPLVTTGGLSGGRLALGLALTVIQCGALYWVRRRPQLVMAIAFATAAALMLLHPYVGSLGAANIALCGLAWSRPPRVSLIGLAAMVALAPLNLAGGGVAQMLLAIAGPALSWALGELGRMRHVRGTEQRERVRAAERERIARELHDVVAHNLAVIVVQAGAAADVFDAQPEQARSALLAIDDAGRSALGELRRLLETVSGEGERAPAPGLSQLGALTDSVRAAGLQVELDVDDGAPLPALVDLAAYRIVQEALTNALRHAHARRVQVRVARAAGALTIEVLDDGSGAPGADGRGIVGMRERAQTLGGTLQTGARPGGGFRVAAELPLASELLAAR
jgi:signal transduction histidine kinase